MSTLADDPRVIAQGTSARAIWTAARRRVSQGEIGALPVILGLIAIAIIFQTQNSNFLTPRNITNIAVQAAGTGTIAVGIVLVLLLGEIDLSVGSVSGMTAAIMAVLSAKHGVSGPVAVLVAVLSGTGIGLLQGWWITKLQVPSFIVTLAGNLGWLGALLYILGDTGTVNLTDSFITNLANYILPVWLGWLLGAALVAIYVVGGLQYRVRRIRAGLRSEPLLFVVARMAVLAAFIAVVVYVMSVNRSPTGFIAIQGVPLGVVIFLGFVVLFDVLMRRTRFGRDVYAVGGNPEAARRAGISIDRVRIAVFILASTMAACGGILAASRLFAVNQSSGGGDVLLNSIAAAVIGGTSLFGGRGHVWSALLGVMVLVSISNGMDLLAFSSSVKYMVTGGVLLGAVTIDALSRRGRLASGRA